MVRWMSHSLTFIWQP